LLAFGLFAVGGGALVAVPPDHRICLVDKPFARGDARSQVLLIGFELARLALAPGDALLFFRDAEFLRRPDSSLAAGFIQVYF